VVPAGQQVLEALAKTSSTFRFEFENFDWGGDYYREHGVMMPADGLDALRGKDAILFGRPATRTSPTTSRCGACA
jgi:tartrate dehydrogenase/decarboxylase/D-malate dehydrogenase